MLLSGRRFAGTAGLAALLLALTPFTGRAAAVTYEPEPPFCERSVIRDPFAAFERMPKLHEPSESGQMGFGPSQLRLWTTPGFRVSGGEVGFAFSLAQRKGLRLHWTAEGSIVEVNGNGHPIGRPRHSIKKIRWMRPTYGKRLWFDISDEPAFYRTTILLSGAADQKLGKFSFYSRVARPTHHAELGLNAPTYQPESTVFMRVENLGNMIAFYGVRYAVEKLEGGSWVIAPESPRGPTILIGISAPPGATGPCGAFWVPPTMAPGSYRISKDVNFVPPGGPGLDAKRFVPRPRATLLAEFQVSQ